MPLLARWFSQWYCEEGLQSATACCQGIMLFLRRLSTFSQSSRVHSVASKQMATSYSVDMILSELSIPPTTT